jgi:hypothetical protein
MRTDRFGCLLESSHAKALGNGSALFEEDGMTSPHEVTCVILLARRKKGIAEPCHRRLRISNVRLERNGKRLPFTYLS